MNWTYFTQTDGITTIKKKKWSYSFVLSSICIIFAEEKAALGNLKVLSLRSFALSLNKKKLHSAI